MAITRFANSANVRSLRSGRVVLRFVDEALPLSRIRKAPVLSSPAWKRSKNSSPRPQPQQRVSFASVQGGLSCTRALSEDVDMSSDSDTASEYRMQAPHHTHLHKSADHEHLGPSVLQDGANTPASILPGPSPMTLHRSTMDAEEESPRPVSRQQGQHDIVNAREQTPHSGFEYIGLPSHDVWDHDGAYAERYCYDHGETEYLLGTPNRWMSADDLGVSEAVLEARLEKCKARPVKSTPAQCLGTLYSHVQRVVQSQPRQWNLV